MAKKRVHINPYTVKAHYRTYNVKSKSPVKKQKSVWIGAGEFVHYPSRNLLYKIYKSEAEGTYADLIGVLYVKEGKKRLEFKKNRHTFIKDIEKGIARKVSNKQGTAIILLYTGNSKKPGYDYPRKSWNKLGKKRIEVMLYASGGKQKKYITRIVYKEPNVNVYWIELYKGHWVNTTRAGIYGGIVAMKPEYKRL